MGKTVLKIVGALLSLSILAFLVLYATGRLGESEKVVDTQPDGEYDAQTSLPDSLENDSDYNEPNYGPDCYCCVSSEQHRIADSIFASLIARLENNPSDEFKDDSAVMLEKHHDEYLLLCRYGFDSEWAYGYVRYKVCDNKFVLKDSSCIIAHYNDLDYVDEKVVYAPYGEPSFMWFFKENGDPLLFDARKSESFFVYRLVVLDLKDKNQLYSDFLVWSEYEHSAEPLLADVLLVDTLNYSEGCPNFIIKTHDYNEETLAVYRCQSSSLENGLTLKKYVEISSETTQTDE